MTASSFFVDLIMNARIGPEDETLNVTCRSSPIQVTDEGGVSAKAIFTVPSLVIFCSRVFDGPFSFSHCTEMVFVPLKRSTTGL